MTQEIVLSALKLLLFIAYMILEKRLGQSKWGSVLGFVASTLIKGERKK